MALLRMLFSELQTIMVNKVTFACFRGEITPLDPSLFGIEHFAFVLKFLFPNLGFLVFFLPNIWCFALEKLGFFRFYILVNVNIGILCKLLICFLCKYVSFSRGIVHVSLC